MRNDLVAGAVIAEAFAERDMDVHRQRLGRRGLVGFLRSAAVIIHGKGLMKLRGSGVGGIARTGTVIFLDQGAVKARRLVHVGFHLDCMIVSGWAGQGRAGYVPSSATGICALAGKGIKR